MCISCLFRFVLVMIRCCSCLGLSYSVCIGLVVMLLIRVGLLVRLLILFMNLFGLWWVIFIIWLVLLCWLIFIWLVSIRISLMLCCLV